MKKKNIHAKLIEVNKEGLCMVQITWKGKRIVEKANKRINRKNNNRLKKLKIKKERGKKRGKLYRTVMAQCRGRGL